MPHSMPVSKLMINRNEWPQLRADTDIRTAIKILRIVTEEKKLEHGHSTPLILDENYNLLGFVTPHGPVEERQASLREDGRAVRTG